MCLAQSHEAARKWQSRHWIPGLTPALLRVTQSALLPSATSLLPILQLEMLSCLTLDHSARDPLGCGSRLLAGISET